MPIKLVCFDLDGCLVDSRETHYHALNLALRSIDPKFEITREEHLSTYDGLSTTQKLNRLTESKGLKKSDHSRVWNLKQEYTARLVLQYSEDTEKVEMLRHLREEGYLVYIASNCTWRNLMLIAYAKGFLPHVDWFISNEEVKYPKPSPEIYLQCMIRAHVSPSEVLIIEDSPIGRKAAYSSGAHVLPVLNPQDLTLPKVLGYLHKVTVTPHPVMSYEGKINVVIPMAGKGSRFAVAGYTFPKPLIQVRGEMTMIEMVVRNLRVNPAKAKFIFIVQAEHCAAYDLRGSLERIAPGCVIIPVSEVTQGSACSVLLAKEYINNDTPLLTANSDQFLEWDPLAFFHEMESVDGGITTFQSTHPKWSFVRLNEQGFVTEVAEKKVISEHATTGVYYFSKGSDYVRGAEEMIRKDIRVNGEFYLCPVYNELIGEGKKIRIHNIERMWGVGVPEDLEYFLKEYKGPI